MTHIELRRDIAHKEMRYGNHEIHIRVKVKTGYYGNYYRKVVVSAVHDGVAEVTQMNRVQLNPEESYTLGPLEELLVFFGGQEREDVKRKATRPLKPLEDQIEEAAQSVFEGLDEVYEYTMDDYEIDVEVGVERIRHEISWTDVDDELERVVGELGRQQEEMT